MKEIVSYVLIVQFDIVDGYHIQLSPLFKTQTSHKLLYVPGILTGLIKFWCPQGDMLRTTFSENREIQHKKSKLSG